MRRTVLCFSLVLVGCTGTGDSSSDTSLHGGDTCTVLTTGNWTLTGAAFRMGDNPMTADLTFDEDVCSFTFSQWSMSMDDLPSGGVIDGDAVQLDGLASRWRTCTGPATDENTASGTCSDDGSDWMMVTQVVGG